MWFLGWVGVAAAGCEPKDVDLEVDPKGASALAIEGWIGNFTVVPADGDRITIRGAACRDTRVRTHNDGERVRVTGRVGAATEFTVELGVPAGIEAVSFHEHHGPVIWQELSARLAVVSSDVVLQVRGGTSVRVAYSSGEVDVSDLSADLVVDRLVGSVKVERVAGSATVERVTGAVDIVGVGGDLAVSGGDGEVTHRDVGGRVSVR